tara:strand:- start:538 stop:1638 length:1101 start_codon:yes stop_codon:yes gene_type:complete
MKKITLFLLFLIGCDNNPIINKNGLKTQNVILITLDGVRWQEVFQGADKRIINNIKDNIKKESSLKSFWVDNKIQRRNLLMPFLWNTIASKGQLYGNKTKGSVMRVTNPYFFSYPGYNELLVGFNDDSVKSNSKIYNPNLNILEFMNSKEGFKGQVAAFASWDVFDWIINKERNDFTINSGAFPLTDSLMTKKQRWMNNFISDLPYEGYGTGVRWDALTQEYAFEYLKLNKPRLLYIAYDESDEFAHQKKYGEYLSIINRLDNYISSIWTWTQSQNIYRNKTTLIITTDHGRGGYLNDQWGNHGQDVKGAEFVWAAIIGPDTPSIGELSNIDTVSTNQISSTISHLLGYEFKSNRKVGSTIKKMIK